MGTHQDCHAIAGGVAGGVRSGCGRIFFEKGMVITMALKIGMVSLGCAKNQVDAEIMMAKLKDAGYELVAEAGLSDIAIVNTCGFIQDAKTEAIEEILELATLKKEGRIQKILVTGCLAQRYQEEVAKELPEVDAVIGLGGNGDIVSAVERVLKGEKIAEFPDKLLLPLSGERVQTTPFFTSYLKIAEGCSNCCSYCAIPKIRGKFRSRPMEDVLAEAERLAHNGVKELNVIAQDTTRYGEDLCGKSMLPELLTELCKIDGLEWIRVLYCYPERVSDELLDVMAKEEKIVKYLDLPMQHCNDEILKKMNRRGGGRQWLTELVQKIRARVPGIILRTTFIVGFPGESWEQFNELAAFVKEMQFERMGCFAYSPEEDTPAAAMEGQIPDKIKQHRQEILMETQDLVVQKQCEAMVGKRLTVMVEGFDRYAGSFFGRSANDAPETDGKVFFTASTNRMNAGSMVEVEITDFMECDLLGEMVEE